MIYFLTDQNYDKIKNIFFTTIIYELFLILSYSYKKKILQNTGSMCHGVALVLR